MDKVRFGRALGFGARQAGKALWQAADAAMTPDPVAARRTGEHAGQSVAKAHTTSKNVRRESKRFGQAVWGPFAKASGVLWLELTGVFFGIFALFAGLELARHHGDFHATGPARQHVWFAAVMLALFGYFCLTSFINARKRSRR